MNDDIYEYEILCILLSNNEKINECNLEQKHFSNRKYGDIYKALNENYKQNGFVDIVEANKKIDDFISFALGCAEHYVTSAHLEFYVEKVEESYKIRAINNIVKDCVNGTISFELMNSMISNVNDEFVKVGTKNKLSDEEIYREIIRKDENLKFEVFTNLSNRIQFIKKGIHVISARPGVGKSAFAINLMNDLSRNYKCIYLNMEMNRQKIYQRMVGCESGVPINSFSNMTSNQDRIVRESIKRINKRKYEIMNGSKSIKAIKSIIAKVSRDEHLILFIDYIGYVTNGKNQSDKDRIGEITRELQNITKDYDVTIFMLAQLNREGNDEPKLIYLKDSGELEQSAETVMFLHNTDRDLNNQEPVYELLVPKNRNGNQLKMDIKFNKPCQKFEEIQYDYDVRV